MAINDILMAASGAGLDKTFIEDVFSTYLYTGNGSTQTINNGIDLAGKGGMVWIKCRNSPDGNTPAHGINDTVRGTSNAATLCTNTNGAAGEGFIGTMGFTSFNSNGFSLSGSNYRSNSSAGNYASWTFRKAPKFFDVVTYTGNGVAGRTINHSLGIAPGMMIVKRTDAAANWFVYHRSTGAAAYLVLNETWAVDNADYYWNNTTPTASVFTVSGDGGVNASGATYVAYLFAHDTTTDGLIQCGSFTKTDSWPSSTPVVLGWEPQFILYKRTDSGTENWNIGDVMRGDGNWGGSGAGLSPNLSNAETTTLQFSATPTGFTIGNATSIGGTYIYMAIRRGPMRTPTDGAKVFSPTYSSATTNTTISTGFPIDLQIDNYTGADSNNSTFNTRLIGCSTNSTAFSKFLVSSSTSAEKTTANYGSLNWTNTSFGVPAYYSGVPTIYWNFKRAPGFFDVVCYTGNGTTQFQSQAVKHNLTTVPELIIIKARDTGTESGDWRVWCKYDGTGGLQGALNLSDGFVYNEIFAPSNTTTFSPLHRVSSYSGGPIYSYNASGRNYVAYLFSSCPGVSKVFSFTGNGSSQTINCGFTNGARLVLIKRTDSTGDWYVWDTARGIIAGSDPHLSLNTTAAEVTTDDTIDPESTGFIVNQVSATNVNVNGASYIGLAIA